MARETRSWPPSVPPDPDENDLRALLADLTSACLDCQELRCDAATKALFRRVEIDHVPLAQAAAVLGLEPREARIRLCATREAVAGILVCALGRNRPTETSHCRCQTGN